MAKIRVNIDKKFLDNLLEKTSNSLIKMKIITYIFILIVLLTSCNNLTNNMKYKKIVEIPEASWICLMKSTNTFFVANDEGNIYEINSKWKILREKYIWKYDFEGIVCNDSEGIIYMLIENTGNLLPISIKKLNKKEELILDISKKERNKYFTAKSWAEWLAMNWDTLYISIQNDKNNLLEFELPKKWKKLKLKKVHDIKSDDLSWMTYYKKLLYILSDKYNKIYTYDLKTEKIVTEINLKKAKWEWIALDEKGIIYLANDEWKIVTLK